MSEEYLNEVLKGLDEKNGFGGEYKFIISAGSPFIAGTGQKCIPLLAVNNLTEKAARILFDQFDESNLLPNWSVPEQFRISLYKNKEEIDYNLLPNIFSETLSI